MCWKEGENIFSGRQLNLPVRNHHDEPSSLPFIHLSFMNIATYEIVTNSNIFYVKVLELRLINVNFIYGDITAVDTFQYSLLVM